MSTSTMPRPVTDTRPGCTATRHDTPGAYRRAGCRCPQAVAAERARKAVHDSQRGPRKRCDAASMHGLTIAAVPPFHAHPDRGCADLADPDLMIDEDPAVVRQAIKLCSRCPFKQACADWALEHRQVYGVWGGVPAKTRRRDIGRRTGRTVGR